MEVWDCGYTIDTPDTQGMSVDQALKEISELLLECKPEKNTHDVNAVAHFDYPKCCERVEGYNQGLDDYEKNIREVLK